MRPILVFLGFLLISFAAAAVGGLFSGPAVRQWYPALRKPPGTPPPWVFAPVWTTLYASMAVAGFLVWRRAGFGGARGAMALFAVQLVLNAAWSWVFFGLRRPGPAFAAVLLLWASILATTIAFLRLSTWAGALFLPYLLWVTFASYLNFGIWRLNGGGGSHGALPDGPPSRTELACKSK